MTGSGVESALPWTRGWITMNASASPARKIDPAQLDESAGQAAASAGPAEASGASVDHAVSRDQAAYEKAAPSIIDLLHHAQRKSKRGAVELAMEYFRLHRGRGRLAFHEYVQYGVYDTSRYTEEQQSRFLTLQLHWPITQICCDMTWQGATEDKWLCSHILMGSGVPVPETLAVIDKTDRIYMGTRKIATAQQFREFAASAMTGEFFGKENRGICSLGAFLVQHADDKGIVMKGQGHIDYDQFMDKFIGDTPYLLQRLQTNHPFFARYTENLATVRVSVLMDKKGIRTPFCILKVPAMQNVADSFWRPGNLACNLDPRSGEILAIRSKDPFGTTEHEAHPETGAAMIGETVPMWDRVLDLVNRCSPIFYPVRYQSMDIAITPEGPTLIEINTGGGWDLLQMGSGEGFLTEEVCEFFRSCGYTKV